MFNLGTEFKSRGLKRQMPKQSVAQIYRKRSPDDYEKAARIRELIGHSLKKHYQACIIGELPPRLLSLLKKLDEDAELSGEQIYETTG